MEDPLLEGGVEVARILRKAGFQAYFAGGCVRDTELGKAPKDYDIATDATPEQVAGLFKRTLMIGAAFGVVKVLFGKGREYEIATYRADGNYSDGRRPDKVAYSKSAHEDVERRDFTINALLMDPETKEVIDHVGGRADIAARLIRAVGDPERRFAEDRLRMLRAVRFAARLGFSIEPATHDAIKKHASEIKVVSVERIVVELDGIWNSPRPAEGFAQLVETTLLAGLNGLLPIASEHVPQVRGRLGRLELVGPDRAHVAWALALADQPFEKIDPIARGLKLSKERLQILERLIRARAQLETLHTSEPGPRLRLVVEGGPLMRSFQSALLEYRIADEAPLIQDAVAAVPERVRTFKDMLQHHAAVRAWSTTEEDLLAHPLPKLPLVNGGDLQQLGLTPGPEFKRILRAVEDAVYAREISSRDEALVLARRLASAPAKP